MLKGSGMAVAAAVCAAAVAGCHDGPTRPAPGALRVVIKGDTVVGVGRAISLTASYPGSVVACGTAVFTSSDSTIAQVVPTRGCVTSIAGRRAGRATITAVISGDTAHAGTLPVTVTPAAVIGAALRPSAVVANGPAPLSVRVILLDDVNGLANDRRPAVTVADSSLLRITGIDPAPAGDSAAAVVRLQPLKAGATSLIVSSGAFRQSFPIALRATAPDSALVGFNAAFTSVDVGANDFPLDAGRTRAIVDAPLHGTAQVAASGLEYQANVGFVGIDSLRYAAVSNGRTDTATVRVVVVPGPYHVTVIGASATFSAVDLNDRGQVAGTLNLSNGTKRAFRWTAGVVDTLTFGSDTTRAFNIDNVGNVLGANFVSDVTKTHTLLWRPGSSNNLPNDMTPGQPGASSNPTAARMSRSGRVFVPPKYVWTNFTLDSIPATISFARINDRGDLFYNPFDGLYSPSALRFADGHVVRLALPGGRGASIEAGLSNAPAAIGSSEAKIPGIFHPYLYDPANGIVDLTTIYGASATVAAINDNGVLVGALGAQPAILANGAAAPLNQLLDSGGFALVSAFAINNAGQILAVARDATGAMQTVLLTLVPR